MKSIKIGLSILLSTLGSISAIERPASEKGKVIPAPEGGVLEKKEDAEVVPANAATAYLGVGGEAAGRALLMHLNLESGLLLSRIDPASPAGLAGLKENDIIAELDGEKLVDQATLRKAVLSKKPGAEVTLKLIREGKVINQKISLGESPLRQRVLPRALVPDQAAEMQDLLENRLGNALGALGNEELRHKLMDQLERALGDQAAGLKQLRFDLGVDLLNGEDLDKNFQGFGSVRLEDQDGSVELSVQNGQRELEVRDPDGRLLFEGPYDSEIDKAAVPEEYRERVERLDMGKQSSVQLKLDKEDLLKGMKKEK